MTIQDDLSLPAELLINTARHAVYRCYSDLGELLYVGTTGHLGRRLAAHVEKAWFLQVRGITLEWYPDELEALAAERRIIHVEHPKFNVQHRNGRALARRPQKGKRRQPPPVQRPRRSGAEVRALALEVIEKEPDISGSELGRRLGVTPTRGRQLRRALADLPAVAPPG
jgi:predicted GIY-YIG superfamily endonuclease